MTSDRHGLTTRRFFLSQAAALPLLAQEDPTEAFRRTRQQAARGKLQPWFPEAGLGVFFHWGPCSVGEIEIGWGMFKDVGAPNQYWPVEKYMALFERFNPQNYDPDRWMAAAAKAGIKYTVFVTRHHDGYALWPSDYGDCSTKQHMKGRDLVRPFVEACRKNGIKAGMYYSPNDWLFFPKGWPYRGFPLRDPKFLYRRPEKSQGLPRYTDMPMERIQEHFETLYAYCKGQVTELMTRYGKIDLLFWDGYDWPIGIDHHGQEMEDYVRKLQPSIVMNDRNMIWEKGLTGGDYSTAFENRDPKQRPEGAWEQCEALCGGWSYRGPKSVCKPASHVIERLVKNRAWGGNYLPDFGPRADGTLPPAYYEICEQLAGWMKHSGESVFATAAGPYPEQCDVPATVKADALYLHFLSPEKKSATLSNAKAPKSAKVLRTGQRVEWKQDGNQIIFTLPEMQRTEFDEVVKVAWK